MPEMISGVLVLLVVVWKACFERQATQYIPDEPANLTYVIMSALVWLNTLLVWSQLLTSWVRKTWGNRYLWRQGLVGVLASFVCADTLNGDAPSWAYIVSMVLSFVLGCFALANLRAYLRNRRKRPAAISSEWSPAFTFFAYMLGLVLFSTLVLMSEGATNEPVSLADAFFMSASATSITGLGTVDVSSVFTPLGKLMLLVDIQVGAVGVMTFTYFVLMMMGKRLAVRDTMSVSSFLDQEGVNIVPALMKSIFLVTLTAEAVGAICLYYFWQGTPGYTDWELWGHAIFHSVSAFCNAGLSTLPAAMEQEGLTSCRASQVVMMGLMLIGTLGFGLYLEAASRLKNKVLGKRSGKRWSTNSWLVVRVMFITMLVGTVALTLIAALEPSVHQQQDDFRFWEAMWNAIGRSAGFSLTNISDYGTVYHLMLSFLMFVGGNPAGTGGGVFATVFALCVLEVYRVLQGKQGVDLHGRRIARSTVDRAMATVVLSIFWIVLTTLLLMFLEPGEAQKSHGVVRLLFLEVSAYTTAGYELGALPYVSDLSKYIISMNMIFGRVGMFTFMMLFIRPKEATPIRLPETRLPLS